MHWPSRVEQPQLRSRLRSRENQFEVVGLTEMHNHVEEGESEHLFFDAFLWTVTAQVQVSTAQQLAWRRADCVVHTEGARILAAKFEGEDGVEWAWL